MEFETKNSVEKSKNFLRKIHTPKEENSKGKKENPLKTLIETDPQKILTHQLEWLEERKAKRKFKVEGEREEGSTRPFLSKREIDEK